MRDVHNRHRDDEKAFSAFSSTLKTLSKVPIQFYLTNIYIKCVQNVIFFIFTNYFLNS